MSFIENDKIVELVISDLLAMVLPRTWIEYMKRGIDSARETFFRESSGTVTNTFLAGWVGLGATMAFQMSRANPKGMSYKAWIDTPVLNAFAHITDDLLKKPGIDTPDKLRQEFIKTFLSRLESTDNIHNFGRYKKHFANTHGKLGAAQLEELVAHYLGKTPSENGKRHHAFNIEETVAKRLKDPANRHKLSSILAKVKDDVLHKHPQGNTKLLSRLQGEAREKFYNELRRAVTQEVRASEKHFIDMLYDVATREGLTDRVNFKFDTRQRHPKTGRLVTKTLDVGVRSTRELLEKAKYFMEEYLNRALVEAHKPDGNDLSKVASLNRQLLRSKLFQKQGASWLQKHLFPNVKDGLIPYSYKSKFFIVLFPVALVTSIGCSMVLVNNWITQKKHQGKKFFPGEVALMNEIKGQGPRSVRPQPLQGAMV